MYFGSVVSSVGGGSAVYIMHVYDTCNCTWVSPTPCISPNITPHYSINYTLHTAGIGNKMMMKIKNSSETGSSNQQLQSMVRVVCLLFVFLFVAWLLIAGSYGAIYFRLIYIHYTVECTTHYYPIPQPKTYIPGQHGESRSLVLELKIIADVGLVGFPNVSGSVVSVYTVFVDSVCSGVVECNL